MKTDRIAVLAVVLTLASSCAKGPGARLDMTVDGLAAGDRVVLQRLDLRTLEPVDTVSLDSRGSFSRRLDVQPGEPEFYYVTRGGRRLASLLVEAGERIAVKSDTVGHYTVEGSTGSSDLQEVERDFNTFLLEFGGVEDSSDLSALYVKYYRGRVKYVMSHPRSLTVVPVLFQQINPEAPVFSQLTDALHFRSACDKLKEVYPHSKYVRALENETQRRERLLEIDGILAQAKETGFPDIVLPDTRGEKRALSGVDAKAVLLHFWTAEDAAQTMLNSEVLMSVYRDYHRRGLEIYSVCIDIDKARWATVVKNQNLPWINVCDGLGAESRALATYSVRSLPCSILIARGEICTASVTGEKALRRELDKVI